MGGVPEVLPPHMIRLAPCSASEMANTLAEAIEDTRQQRAAWAHELKVNSDKNTTFSGHTDCEAASPSSVSLVRCL